jgi:hypothetical protein
MEFVFLVDILCVLFPVVAALAVYEGVRGCIALRRRERSSRVATDFVATGVLLVAVVAILYFTHGATGRWPWSRW